MSAELEAVRSVVAADVFKAGERAASLVRTRSGIEFRYADAWIAAGRPPVATTLPVTDRPVVRPAGGLPAFFAGLLPEGRRLGALRRAVKTSADDELSLLLAVGDDAVGDIQVVPAGSVPADVPPRVLIGEPTEIRFADLLVDLDIRPLRTALPGVQDKASAAMINVPVARAGERYILKLNPREYPHLVENEAFFLAAARRSGLETPSASLVRDADGKAGLLVARFDRATVDGTVRALAMEDGCQVLDRPPADKYLVGTDRVFAALAGCCDSPLVAARDLLRQLAFAYLTGNGDAHAKNFSVVRSTGVEWRISPAYDLPSSYPYGDRTMAMSIGGRTTGDYGAADFVGLGGRLGVSERVVRRVLGELVARTDLWIDGLTALPFDVGVVRKLRRVVDYRRQRLSSGHGSM